MALDPITSLFEVGKSVIERIWPDANKRAQEIRKLEEMKQAGDLAALNAQVKLMLAQLEVNKVEAGNASLFIAGWRPFIGWVGGIALAYQFVLYPLLVWGWAGFQAAGGIPGEITPPPILDTGALFSMVTAMLGIGAMRSHDKRQGIQTDRISS